MKILVKSKSFKEVKQTALSLEAESGGILVSVDKVSKGYAIVVFRGKNYKRPSTLRPRNLLSKRKALARSIELQRHQVLLISYCVGFLKFSLVRCLKIKEQLLDNYPCSCLPFHASSSRSSSSFDWPRLAIDLRRQLAVVT